MKITFTTDHQNDKDSIFVIDNPSNQLLSALYKEWKESDDK